MALLTIVRCKRKSSATRHITSALNASKHPPILVLANVEDDRVAPLHARKLVAALRSRHIAPGDLRNRSFGHQGAYTLQQQAEEDADILIFLNKFLASP